MATIPKRPGQPGQRRQIRVKANEPNLAVRARDSYIFNPPGTAVANDNNPQNQPVLRKLTGSESALQLDSSVQEQLEVWA